ncbi:hypothetical protein LCGC14_2018690 [marine sediment metagenome]|uniref:Uncharacterized protein n=1 Tax=marine sediment metagenome TaxID=412755 RepID=A0A0F9FKN4_9ZZZZ
MRYFLIRDSVIENCILWDGERPFNPGPDVQLILEAELPGLRIGDRVSGPASEQEPGSELEAELEPEPRSEPEPEPD